MPTTRSLAQVLLRTALIAVLLAAAALPAGCSLIAARRFTVADPGGLYHVLVPAGWIGRPENGLITLYAASTPPKSSTRLETLTALIFAGAPAKGETRSLQTQLTDSVKERSVSRKWTDVVIQAPVATTIGGRPAFKLLASATDGNGQPFKGAYYLIETSGRQVFIAVSSPAASWAKDQKALNKLLTTDWHWHIPADATSSVAPTAAPGATATSTK